MALITQTIRGAITDAARTTLSATDSLVYKPNTNQVLEIANGTAGTLSVLIFGDAAPGAYPIPGSGGTTVNLSTGKAISISTGKTFFINLDAISAYLPGGAVYVTGGTGAVATLLAN